MTFKKMRKVSSNVTARTNVDF